MTEQTTKETLLEQRLMMKKILNQWRFLGGLND